MSDRSAQLYREFCLYHEANPRVYELICKYADRAIRAGYTEYAIAIIWELIRWEIMVTNRSNIDADFAMPNNHRSQYARLWNREHPCDPKFFNERALRSEGGPVDRFGRSLDGDGEAE